MSSRERNLVIAFVALICCAVILFGARYYKSKRKTLDTEYQNITQEVMELQAMVADSERWTVREQWLNENLPDYIDDEKMRLALAQVISNTKGYKLEISEQEFPDPTVESHFAVAKASFRATGELDEVLVWLQSQITKHKFLTTPFININQPEDNEPVFDIKVHQYYAKPQL